VVFVCCAAILLDGYGARRVASAGILQASAAESVVTPETFPGRFHAINKVDGLPRALSGGSPLAPRQFVQKAETSAYRNTTLCRPYDS